jgi:hypothetical protein
LASANCPDHVCSAVSDHAPHPLALGRLAYGAATPETDADIEHLVQALGEIWAEVGLAKTA